jgi:hypothetical protein
VPQTDPDVARWLQRVSGTRLDTEHLLQTVMDQADWCAAMDELGTIPVGCQP